MGNKLQLQIPTPCHENWENMLPAEKGKFCQACSKEVVDFTLMNNDQLFAYFKKSNYAPGCGRFTDDQLHRAIQQSRKPLPGIKYLFKVVIPAFLISMKADAQIKSTKHRIINKTKVELVESIEPGERIKSLATTLEREAVNPSLIPIQATLVGHVGGYIAGIEISKVDTLFSSMSKIFNDTIEMFKPFNKQFSIYPNPVVKGQSITISNNKLLSDNYSIELINFSGQTVHKEIINLSRKQNISFSIPLVSSGSYFIKLTAQQSGKSYTEKIIIE